MQLTIHFNAFSSRNLLDTAGGGVPSIGSEDSSKTSKIIENFRFKHRLTTKEGRLLATGTKVNDSLFEIVSARPKDLAVAHRTVKALLVFATILFSVGIALAFAPVRDWATEQLFPREYLVKSCKLPSSHHTDLNPLSDQSWTPPSDKGWHFSADTDEGWDFSSDMPWIQPSDEGWQFPDDKGWEFPDDKGWEFPSDKPWIPPSERRH